MGWILDLVLVCGDGFDQRDKASFGLRAGSKGFGRFNQGASIRGSEFKDPFRFLSIGGSHAILKHRSVGLHTFSISCTALKSLRVPSKGLDDLQAFFVQPGARLWLKLSVKRDVGRSADASSA